jgi:hypothetical protein
MKKFTLIFSALIVSGLMLGLLACNLPFVQISLGTPPTATTAPIATEQPTNNPMADVPPTAAPPVTPANQKSYDSGVINFNYDMSLFQDLNPQTMPAVQLDPNAMPFGVGPLHTELTLKGYVISGHFWTPKMYIWPAQEYGVMLSTAQDATNTLKLMIANQSGAGPDALPFLPPQNAAQIFHSNFKHVQFQNGAGIRYLAMMGQAAYMPNNNMVFYTFQGITSDGKTYISIILPVTNPILPANGDVNPGEDYVNLLNGVVSQLNLLPDNSFTPDLALLDQMVQSITLK